MPAHNFDLPLIQAISDWQRSSNSQRAERLKKACASLPAKFRTGGKHCFRQVALTKNFVWDLIAEDCLREKVSSWTRNYRVAMDFKGGVPPEDGEFKGVIIEIQKPMPGQIVVNLDRLYKDRDFLAALEANKSLINGYADGAGRWRGSQEEVVIEVDTISKDAIRSLGGYSSSHETLEDLVHLNFIAKLGRLATAKELEYLKTRVGPSWLGRDATKRVLARTEQHVDMLREVRRMQQQAAATKQHQQ